MSLPPQIISIKRRRDEDPVDTLYIDRKQRRVTHQSFLFRRHVGFEPVSEAFKASEIHDVVAPQPEQTRESLAAKDYSIPAPNMASPKQENQESEARAAGQNSASPATPRKFYLSVTDKLLAPSLGPVHDKTRKAGHAGDVAVFVENYSGRPKAPTRPTLTSQPVGAVASTRSVESNGKSGIIYEDLLKHALGSDYVEGLISPNAHGGGLDDAMDTSPDDYVYDTYIRQLDSANTSAADSNIVTSAGGIGFVVITEQDESLWEAYAEDGDEIDPADWDSEQDDENAENYYGADYPEDEIASDDEFDGGAYDYRHGASDDEEYDIRNENAWSDEGDADLYPWRERGVA